MIRIYYGEFNVLVAQKIADKHNLKDGYVASSWEEFQFLNMEHIDYMIECSGYIAKQKP